MLKGGVLPAPELSFSCLGKELNHSPTHYGQCLLVPSAQNSWRQLLEAMGRYGQAELIVCGTKLATLVGQEAWGVGWLELRPQAKNLTSFRAASPTVPGQGI